MLKQYNYLEDGSSIFSETSEHSPTKRCRNPKRDNGFGCH